MRMSALRDRLKCSLIGTPAGDLARRVTRARFRRSLGRDPKLAEVAAEDAHVDAFVERHVADGVNCLDAGCHLGSVLSDFCRRSPGGKHVAFEPTPRKAALLRRKFAGRADVRQKALGDAAGTATFYDNAGASGFSGLRRPGGGFDADVSEYDVEIARLDDELADATIGFVKIDVEGAELMAFRGGRDLFRRCRPALLFECTKTGLDAFDATAEQVHAEVAGELGYDVWVPADWHAGKPPLDAAAFAAATLYPFRAFNFVALPRP